jgi:hypothetical protein
MRPLRDPRPQQTRKRSARRGHSQITPGLDRHYLFYTQPGSYQPPSSSYWDDPDVLGELRGVSDRCAARRPLRVGRCHGHSLSGLRNGADAGEATVPAGVGFDVRTSILRLHSSSYGCYPHHSSGSSPKRYGKRYGGDNDKKCLRCAYWRASTHPSAARCIKCSE